MTNCRRNIAYLLLLAIVVSSSFGISVGVCGSSDANVRLGAFVGASHTPQTDICDCRKECESCFARERTCEFGNVRLNTADFFPRRLARPSSHWASPTSLGASSAATFIATIRFQI